MEHLKTRTAKDLMKLLGEIEYLYESIKNIFISIRFKDKWESYINIDFECASENRSNRIFFAKTSFGDRLMSTIESETGLHNFGGVCDCICDNVDILIEDKDEWNNPFIGDCHADISISINLHTLSI